MTEITKNDLTGVTPDSPAIKPLVGSPLGKAQVAITQLSELPDGFVVPSVDEMAFGPEICDHSCDVEHEQVVDGRRFVTSVIWTSDGGVGTFPNESIIGCQWLATINEWHEPIGRWYNGWEDERVAVTLDCDADAPTDVAIAEAMRVLTDAVNISTHALIISATSLSKI